MHFLLQDFFDMWIGAGTPASEFIRRSVLESAKPARAAGRAGYRSCDGYCMALVLDRSVVHSAEPVYATVELSGQLTRGQMVVDWDGLLGQPCNALIVKELDIGKIQALFMLMVRPQSLVLSQIRQCVQQQQQTFFSNSSTSLPTECPMQGQWVNTADSTMVPQAVLDAGMLFDTNNNSSSSSTNR